MYKLIINSVKAVSYTHLDVYKRQVCSRPRPENNINTVDAARESLRNSLLQYLYIYIFFIYLQTTIYESSAESWTQIRCICITELN